ncbi:MAG: hypothetical protein JWN73_2412 [Betaproteobacteria bacterium]|nr:hypothetical protein [Betaproteobacteria bacterium]
MTREEIVSEFNRLLDDHVVWRRGHWDHRSYKLAFFKLFRAAYEGGFFPPARALRADRRAGAGRNHRDLDHYGLS